MNLKSATGMAAKRRKSRKIEASGSVRQRCSLHLPGKGKFRLNSECKPSGSAAFAHICGGLSAFFNMEGCGMNPPIPYAFSQQLLRYWGQISPESS
jgi:hypothetical protein